jgi:hypothetical protein
MDRNVETIAFALAGCSFEMKHRMLVDAFKHCLAQRPDLHEHELDPRVVDLVAEIFLRIAQIEQERGRVC